MIRITKDAYHELTDAYQGICRACKAEHDMVEPDAENYSCEACGEDEVFGVEQLLIRGELEIK